MRMIEDISMVTNPALLSKPYIPPVIPANEPRI